MLPSPTGSSPHITDTAQPPLLDDDEKLSMIFLICLAATGYIQPEKNSRPCLIQHWLKQTGCTLSTEFKKDNSHLYTPLHSGSHIIKEQHSLIFTNISREQPN